MEEDDKEADAAAADDIVPLARKAGRAIRNRRQGATTEEVGAEEEVEGPAASKRARVDHGEQVKQLFSASATTICDT